MFEFLKRSVTCITLLVIQTATFENVMELKNDFHHLTKRSIFDESSFFFKITDFFGISSNNAIDLKPEFITTLDIIRLLNEEYAMKQFYCVTNKGPCDSVGMRLKATLPEELNSECNRCTSTEMNNIRLIISYVKQNYPDSWICIEPIYKNNNNNIVTI